MPLYQFQCDECGYIQEEIMSVSDVQIMTPACQKCEGRTKRQITAPAALILDTPTWLDQSVRDAVQDPADQKKHPIETRKDLEQWTKSKGMVAVG